jgi:hypothetical protein
MSDATMIAQISAELDTAAAEPKPKQRRAKRDQSGQQVQSKRGQPRPYRKLADDLLTARITKLTARLERAKKQVKEGPRG